MFLYDLRYLRLKMQIFFSLTTFENYSYNITQKAFVLLLFAHSKMEPKNKKIETRHTNFSLIWVQKDIWVEEISLLEVWVRGGRGFKLKVWGMYSYPVYKCIHFFLGGGETLE